MHRSTHPSRGPVPGLTLRDPERRIAPLLAASALASASMACTVATDATEPEELAQTTHAVIQVRHSQPVLGPERADAMAGVVRVPLTTDPDEVLKLAGLRDPLPPIGSCETALTSVLPDATAPTLSQLPHDGIELLPIDELLVETPGGQHRLAPRAFPSVSNWISGVVYTSRDQDADSLPAAGSYRIRVMGVDGAFDVETTHESPPGIAALTVSGVPLPDLSSHSASGPLDLTWTPSENALDVVAVTLASSEFRHTCSYADGTGTGTMALAPLADAALVSPGTSATLSVRRVRTGVSAGEAESFVLEVRFDFSVSADLTFE